MCKSGIPLIKKLHNYDAAGILDRFYRHYFAKSFENWQETTETMLWHDPIYNQEITALIGLWDAVNELDKQLPKKTYLRGNFYENWFQELVIVQHFPRISYIVKFYDNTGINRKGIRNILWLYGNYKLEQSYFDHNLLLAAPKDFWTTLDPWKAGQNAWAMVILRRNCINDHQWCFQI